MHEEFIKKAVKAAELKRRHDEVEKAYKDIKKIQEKGNKLVIISYDRNGKYICKFTAKKWILEDILELVEEEINLERYKVSTEIELFQEGV